MIRTERLELVPATPALTRAALHGPRALAAGLGAAVPATWPPEYLDPASLEFTLERLAAGADQAGWWLHFVVLRDAGGGRTLVGSAGYKGPPSDDGTVEVGYGIVSDHRRRGYASEVVRGLVRNHEVPVDLYKQAEAELGTQKLVEAVTLTGLYGMIGLLIKAFDVPPATDDPPTF